MDITSPTIPWTTTDRTAVRTPSDDVRAVPAALRSEWIKLTALRANKVILALTAVIGAVIAGGLAATATDPTLTASELFIYPLPLVAMLAGVTGILMFTGEAQHGTLAVTLAARPARWVIVAAKTTTAAVVGLALGVDRDDRRLRRRGARRRRARQRIAPHLPGAVGAALHRPRRPHRPRRRHDRPPQRRRHHRPPDVVVRRREPVRPDPPRGRPPPPALQRRLPPPRRRSAASRPPS